MKREKTNAEATFSPIQATEASTKSTRQFVRAV